MSFFTNIGPYQWKGLADGFGVPIGPYMGNTAPVITGQSASQLGHVGDLVSLWITASGSPAPTYQWYLNSILLPGETGLTLDVVIGYDTDGTYTCIATNAVGSATATILVFVSQSPRYNAFNLQLDIDRGG